MSRGVAAAPEVGPLDPAGVPPATEVLARAFRDNPLNRAAIGSPDAERRLRSNRAGTVMTMKQANDAGTRYFQETLRSWSTRRRGRVHLSQSWMKTPKVVFAKKTAMPEPKTIVARRTTADIP